MHVDNKVMTTASVANDEGILSSVLAGDSNVDDDEIQSGRIDFSIEGPKCSSWHELEGALDAIQNYASLFSSQLEEINSLVMKGNK